jgi:hypothetical protein
MGLHTNFYAIPLSMQCNTIQYNRMQSNSVPYFSHVITKFGLDSTQVFKYQNATRVLANTVLLVLE